MFDLYTDHCGVCLVGIQITVRCVWLIYRSLLGVFDLYTDHCEVCLVDIQITEVCLIDIQITVGCAWLVYRSHVRCV